jgi:iron complex outermembrane receptor protein
LVLSGLFTLSGLGAELSARQSTIAGRVIDAGTGQPLSEAQVYLRGGGAGTLSNAQGAFRLQSPAGGQTLVVELLGYLSTDQHVNVPEGGTVNVDVVLTSTALSLGGIVVTSNRSQAGERRIVSANTTDVITNLEIEERATFNPADHLRNTAGVDVITTGLQNSNVVVRGFNNIFSGALHMLSDYRLAGVPSLRVNLMHFIPTVDEDIDRIEVVLGPGSALYGPNTANGVVHMLSKSPLDDQNTTVTLGSGVKGTGNPSAFQGVFRSAFLLSDDFGMKVSGQYLNAEEWGYLDPGEEAAASFATANPGRCQADKIVRGVPAPSAGAICARIGQRDFDIERWSVETRADWRFADDGTFVATYGRNSSTGIELTGLGAGQTDNWVYDFFQGRLSKGRFFTQAYYNTSDAGDSFLLRDGLGLVDESSLFVGQAQHGVELAEGRQDFTYGFDYFATRPNSRGTIYGSYENDDNMNEWGIYLQSKTAITPKLDFIAAGRVDSHSILPDDVFSPRAAFVFKPTEDHGIRLSYNQAFSTPSALNFFLDISGGLAPDPLGALGFTTRAYGSGPDGWSLRGPDDTFEWMRSPFTPTGADQLTPADMSLLWPYFVGVLQASGGIDAGTAAFLQGLTPTNDDILRLAIDPNTQQASPLASLNLPDLPPTVESRTETFELGWTGVLNDRIAVSADVYYTRKNDFISPLIVQTPLIALSPAHIQAYLTPFVGPDNAAAIAAAGGTSADPNVVPLGVVSSDDVGARGADLILSYRNVGDIDLWGGDIAIQAFLTDDWILSASYSHVSDDYFEIDDGAPIALNAPTMKGALGLAYRNSGSGLTASTRVRFNAEFPAESAGYVGTRCLPTSAGGIFEEDCVGSAAVVDLTGSYAIPTTRATVQLSVTNLFDSVYRSFVGVPDVGRFTMLRVKYDLF